MKRYLGIVFLLFLIFGTIWIVRSHMVIPMQENEGEIFGTFYHIKYRHSSDLHDDIRKELLQVDSSLSMFNPKSNLSAVNKGETNYLSPMLAEVLEKAIVVSGQTDGAFDVTVGPLVNAWGFGFKGKASLPTPQIVDSILQYVGVDKISVRSDSLFKENDNVVIDLGAIAKGYGVDRVASLLQSKGVRDYMVEIGGEVVVHGSREGNEPWRVGISKPSMNTAETDTVLTLSDVAVATSGNYRNFRIENGIKYSHTINPRTGRPVQHSLLSATVVAKDCASADAYATAFMVMGVDNVKRFLSKHPELKVYLIYADPLGQLSTWTNL